MIIAALIEIVPKDGGDLPQVNDAGQVIRDILAGATENDSAIGWRVSAITVTDLPGRQEP